MAMGVRIDQEDMPHWAGSICRWLMMVKALHDSPKPVWSSLLTNVLAGESYRPGGVGPGQVYVLYSDYADTMEAEALKASRPTGAET